MAILQPHKHSCYIWSVGIFIKLIVGVETWAPVNILIKFFPRLFILMAKLRAALQCMLYLVTVKEASVSDNFHLPVEWFYGGCLVSLQSLWYSWYIGSLHCWSGDIGAQLYSQTFLPRGNNSNGIIMGRFSSHDTLGDCGDGHVSLQSISSI